MLHVVSQSSTQLDINAFLRSVNANDAVLFVQNGVSSLIEGNPLFTLLNATEASVYVLRNDLEARGMLNLIAEDVTVVDYHQYVDLTVEHTPQLLW